MAEVNRLMICPLVALNVSLTSCPRVVLTGAAGPFGVMVPVRSAGALCS